MDRRKQKIEKVIKNELSKIFLRNLKIIPGVLITITGVRVSSGHQHAKIYLSIFPEYQRTKVLKLIVQRVYKFQKLLDKRLLMRPVPKIRFVLDESGNNFSKISELLHNN